MVIIGLVVAVLAGAGGLAMALVSASGEPGRRIPAVVARWSAWGGFSVLVIAGAVTVLGAAAVPLVLVGIAAAAWIARHRLPPIRTARPGGRSVGAAPDTALGELTNAQLGWAWSSSHARIARVRDASELCRVAELRRRQLDEIERRDPAGFRRWAGTMTWISADSAPFLRR
jgi:hypothetical protein